MLAIIRWSFYVWGALFLFERLIPLHSSHSNRLQITTLILLYLTIMAGMALFTLAVKRLAISNTTENRGLVFQSQTITKIINYSLILSAVGTIMVIYDKVAIQGINYLDGISAARVQWQNLAAGRQGVSSIFSVLGNLFANLYFIPLNLVHLHWEKLPRGFRRHSIFLALILLISASFLSGGRSIMLLAMASVLAVALIRKAHGRGYMPGGSLTSVGLPALSVILVLGYAMYVFSSRAGMSNMALRAYSFSWISELGGHETSEFYDAEARLDENVAPFYLAMTVGAYLSHGLWIFERIVDLPNRPGFSTFRTWVSHLNKLPFVSIRMEPYHFSGYFATLPGFLYYDYGILGMILWAIIHGILLGQAMFLISSKRAGTMGFGLVIFVLMTTLLAPIGAAFDMMVFPFLAIGYGLFYILCGYRWSQFSWMSGTNSLREPYMQQRLL